MPQPIYFESPRTISSMFVTVRGNEDVVVIVFRDDRDDVAIPMTDVSAVVHGLSHLERENYIENSVESEVTEFRQRLMEQRRKELEAQNG